MGTCFITAKNIELRDALFILKLKENGFHAVFLTSHCIQVLTIMKKTWVGISEL
jgi:hypothetical protein